MRPGRESILKHSWSNVLVDVPMLWACMCGICLYAWAGAVLGATPTEREPTSGRRWARTDSDSVDPTAPETNVTIRAINPPTRPVIEIKAFLYMEPTKVLRADGHYRRTHACKP